jgi:hypothetical protein
LQQQNWKALSWIAGFFAINIIPWNGPAYTTKGVYFSEQPVLPVQSPCSLFCLVSVSWNFTPDILQLFHHASLHACSNRRVLKLPALCANSCLKWYVISNVVARNSAPISCETIYNPKQRENSFQHYLLLRQCQS